MEALREEIYDYTSDPAQESVISSIREAACSGVLLLTDFAGKAAGLQNRERSYWILFCRKNVPVVRKYIFWHLKRIQILEWRQYTE